MNKMLRTAVLVTGLLLSAPSGFVLAADAVDGAVYVGKDRVYIDPAKFDSTRYMSPPPVGLEAEEDMLAVVRWQDKRTAAMAAQTVIDSEQSVFVFADVVGEKFSAANFPTARKFFRAVYRTESHLNKQGKERWARLRPPGQNDQIKPVSRFANQGSYPSGHAAFGWLTGIVLADMIPEKRDEIMARARAFGLNRIIGGAHFPSDVEAGRILAVACAVEMRNNPAFLADFAEAKREVRAGLGLPQ